MRLILILILFSVVGCQNPRTNSKPAQSIGATSSQPSTNEINSMELPQKVIDYVKNNLPGWSIPDTFDYSQTWWSIYDRNQIPYFVAADVNSDSIADYALILKNSNAIGLFILVGSGNTFIHWKADDFKEPFKGNDIQFGLKIEPPEEISCVVQGKDAYLTLKSKGIALMELEVKNRIYYWFGGQFKVFKTI